MLAVDSLAICTKQAVLSGWLKVYQMPRCIKGITLLQYVDYMTFFMEGSAEEAKNLSVLMELFADCSGLHVNQAKSMLVPFNLPPEEDVECSSALGIPIGNLPIQYHELPLTNGRIRNMEWWAMIDKVECRLEGW